MPSDPVFVPLLERIVVGGVALTARVLQAVAPQLSLLQWRVLVVAGEAVGPPTPRTKAAAGIPVGELGRRLGVSPSSATRVVGRLERQGLVRLVRAAEDRRFMLVSLTEDGLALRRSVMDRRREALAAIVAGIHPQPGPAVLAALSAIADDLEDRP